MLGNLSIEQIENRSGVLFPDDVKRFLRKTYSSNADMSNGEWHCFDIPYCLVINEDSKLEFEEKVFPVLRQGKLISVSFQESESSKFKRLRKEKEIQIAESEDVYFQSLQRLIRKLNLDKKNDITFGCLCIEVVKPGHYVYYQKDIYNGKINRSKVVNVKTSVQGLKSDKTVDFRHKNKISKNYNRILCDVVDGLGMCSASCNIEKHELIMDTKISK